jgi:hypothetical protein
VSAAKVKSLIFQKFWTLTGFREHSLMAFVLQLYSIALSLVCYESLDTLLCTRKRYFSKKKKKKKKGIWAYLYK